MVSEYDKVRSVLLWVRDHKEEICEGAGIQEDQRAEAERILTDDDLVHEVRRGNPSQGFDYFDWYRIGMWTDWLANRLAQQQRR